MRASLGIPPADLARLLVTRPDVIAHLEAGRIRALPPMHETARLVTDYGRLLGIDAQPILNRIREQPAEKSPPLEAAPASMRKRLAGAFVAMSRPGRKSSREAETLDGEAERVPDTRTAPPAPPYVPPQLVAATGQQDFPAGRATRRAPGKEERRAGRRRKRALATAGVSALLLMGAVWAAQSKPAAVYAAVDQLPPSLAKTLRNKLEWMVTQVKAGRDGLTWIETSDPKNRKADKLPVRGQGG